MTRGLGREPPTYWTDPDPWVLGHEPVDTIVPTTTEAGYPVLTTEGRLGFYGWRDIF